ncbi:MAG TPA: SDR family NAD(P)-dependent oxidoreductase [Pyrinomonadaceae bacterium]|jgi:NAD(P)-dependent dehydrogenase (short-subunit alcohol dehydrogenase family)
MSEKLDGQVVIVTGASSGIGAATARKLAAAGAHVLMVARRQERLDALKVGIEALGGRATVCAADITAEADRERIVQTALGISGRLDALVNNAGYGQRGPIELVPIAAIRRNFELNLFSTIALTQLVIPVMRRQGGGRIVNVSSVAGRVARPLSSVYDATKHALEAVSDGLRGELAPFGIKVVVVEPGFILTEFVEVANKESADVLADAGPYAPWLANFKQAYARARRMAGRPEEIAALVHTALTSARPRTRYAAPRHARLALALKRLLPERWFDYILDRQAGIRAEQLRPAATEPARD